MYEHIRDANTHKDEEDHGGEEDHVMHVDDLDTPAAVVDLAQLERNLGDMAERTAAAGVNLRPHVKTHKTVEITEMQLAHGAAGITVAKLGEAEIMAAAGFDDILVAYQVVGRQKVERLLKLHAAIRIQSCVDSMPAALALSSAAAAGGQRLEVLIDVDTGLGRTGLAPQAAISFGREVAELPGLEVRGVFSYAGYRPKVPDVARRREWARQEAGEAVHVAAQLRQYGVNATVVSIAGTSSAMYADELQGVTEVRPGTYVFGDANYSRLGIADMSGCALWINATVISRPAPDRAVIDAGSKALSSDAAAVGAGHGYLPQYPGAVVSRIWEEHAVVELDADARGLAVGQRVAVIPNHVCTAVNLTDTLHVVRDDRVVDRYAVVARGATR